MARKNALGRGLGALIDNADNSEKKVILNTVQEIDIDKIKVNPYQPRNHFDEELLKELSASISSIGIIQPVTLRMTSEDEFQIIAGERRFRASKMAGLKTIPAYIRAAGVEEMLEMALVENIQREDLDAIEIALSYQRLIEECNLTQESMSEKVGKKRSTIANYLRLLKLPAEIQKGIREKLISMGHARALINLPEADTQIMVYNEILKNEFSVRKVEEIVRQLNDEGFIKKQPSSRKKLPEDILKRQKALSNALNAKVKVSANNNGAGKIVISFNTNDQLKDILETLDQIND